MRKRVYLVLGLLCLTLTMTFLGSATAKAGRIVGKSNEYEITSYDVNIVVSEDNVLHITERIDAYFNVKKHGIYRKIPLKNTVKRLDGTSEKNHARISKITTNITKDVSYADGYCTIKLGDPDRTITGPCTYEITYDYALEGDSLSDKDEFYFNLIGTEWDAKISNVSFSIQMPKEFDKELLGFSKGHYGFLFTKDVIYQVNGTLISGYVESTFQRNEGLTVRLELPEGYFTKRKGEDDILIQLGLILPPICLLISGVLWYMVGRDNLVVETVEFSAPENRNSAEVAFALKGKVDQNDIVSLLVYLANKGYLEIDEVETTALFGIKGQEFRLKKLKEYDGYIEEERVFLDGLFAGGDVVVMSDLHNKFYRTISKIEKMMNSKENREFIFEKNSINKSWLLILMVLICIALICIPPLLYANSGYFEPQMIFPILFPMIACMVVFQGLFSDGKLISKIVILIWGAVFGGAPFVFMILPAITEKEVYIRNSVIGILCIIGIYIFKAIMSKRTKYGNEILGRVRGFKNFLEVVEKDRLEALIEENPNYYFDVLPYTYVFGISKKWMEKFEFLVMESPSWYRGSHHAFDSRCFHVFMSSTSSSMTSSPSSSGGSGGGFSGGGSGGGGGGSW